MIDHDESQKGNPFIHKRTFTTDTYVIEEDGTGAVVINGFTIYGFVDTGTCSICSEPIRVYDVQHDSYICVKENLWCDRACSDEFCNLCNNRPERPLPYRVNDDTYPKRDSSKGWSRIKKFIGIDVPPEEETKNESSNS